MGSRINYRHQCTIERMKEGYEDGMRKNEPEVVESDVPCAVSYKTNKSVTRGQKDGEVFEKEVDAKVFIPAGVDVERNDIVTVRGREFKIMNYRNPHLMDEHLELLVIEHQRSS